jgi:hypothetical protein
MSLAALQTALAKILTDEKLRNEFLAERVTTVRRLNMSTADAEALLKVDTLALRNFTDCLRSKRILDVRKVLPLTCQVLGDEFDRLSRAAIKGPPRAGRHRADAAALVRHLCESFPHRSTWVADLARYELAFVIAGTAGTCCILRRFRFPVASIARTVLSGRPSDGVTPRTSIGLWLRLGTKQRLMHVSYNVPRTK